MHSGLVGVVDRAISAIQAAYDGVSQSQWCTTCYYKDTPGWQKFSSESKQITKEFPGAEQAWESAVEQAKISAENAALPAKPNV